MRLNSSTVEAIKASPPVTYFGGVVAGVQWGEVASMLAALYTVLLIGDWTWKKVSAWRAKRRDRAQQ